MMLPKSICIFVRTKVMDLVPVWLRYDDLPEECKEEYGGQWEGQDLDLPSKHQHFFFEHVNVFHHTSELIEIREGNPLFGSGYQFYDPNYGEGTNAVLAVAINGAAILGHFIHT